MDKPICKLCGHRHWGLDHVWPEEKIEVVYPEITEKGVVLHDKPKFDRVAYQREYMRKRRAKK